MSKLTQVNSLALCTFCGCDFRVGTVQKPPVFFLFSVDMARASSVEPTKLVADSATNGLHSGSLGSQGDDDVQPEFVGDVDRWRCPICSQVVQHAVQTFCGHRFCESCLESYLPADGTPARCPAKEEDCQMISREGHNVSCPWCVCTAVYEDWGFWISLGEYSRSCTRVDSTKKKGVFFGVGSPQFGRTATLS